MLDTVVKLKDIVNRDVSPDEAGDVAEYLLACLTHVTNARPLFGVVDTDTMALEWTAGGADFHESLCQDKGDIRSVEHLFRCFGISDDATAASIEQMIAMGPGAWVSLVQPMMGANGRFFRLVLRRRREPNATHVQFSLLDITAFQETAKRAQAMAKDLVEKLDAPIVPTGGSSHAGRNPGAKTLLLSVLEGLETLFILHDDIEISALSKLLSIKLTQVSECVVALLRGFEQSYETSHWQPEDLNPRLRPAIPTHNVPVNDWRQLHRENLVLIEGEPALGGIDVQNLKSAFDFISYAGSLMVISPTPDKIFILNGPVGGQVFSNIDDFVRALGVEENSMRTAVEYFSGLGVKPAMGLFAMNGQNMEAWGRPALYGGWQAMLASAQGQGVDVRGLFHGLKNLLLHLQVLYVVHTRADVDQVHSGLSETVAKIRSRLDELDCIARTGRRARTHVFESVQQWLDAAALVGKEGAGRVRIQADRGVQDLKFFALPGEMEDTLEELARNAFIHGAKIVTVTAYEQHGHLRLEVSDDGVGLSDEKLGQLRRVLKSRTYDPTLSTRADGTGNGLLSAANAVSRFVDGRFWVDHASDGNGVKITISLKLPD
jgi:hypothetical protein